MSNSISAVVDSAIESSGRSSFVTPIFTEVKGHVVTALEERDSAIADTLVEKGTEMGASEEAINALLIEVGLRPEPVVESTPEADDETPAWAKALIERIERVEAVATAAQQRYGFRV